MNGNGSMLSNRTIHKFSDKRRYAMKIKKLILITFLVLAVALSTVGTASAADTDIVDVTSSMLGQVVTVTGTITLVEGNEFILTDLTGFIYLDGGPAWYNQLVLADADEVTVTGEVDLKKDGVTLEIDMFSYVDANGNTITIQTAGTRPPWAGGPQKRGGGG
jgi:uncharacterized protein YdeI (BOF family)